MTLLKSIGAVIAGFLIVVILSTVTDEILHATNIMPRATILPTSMALLAIAYRTIYTILGSYVTARLAPHHPIRHAIILGCIGTLAGTGGAIAASSMGFGPAWYALALAIEALPCAWLGAMLYSRK